MILIGYGGMGVEIYLAVKEDLENIPFIVQQMAIDHCGIYLAGRPIGEPEKT